MPWSSCSLAIEIIVIKCFFVGFSGAQLYGIKLILTEGRCQSMSTNARNVGRSSSGLNTLLNMSQPSQPARIAEAKT